MTAPGRARLVGELSSEEERFAHLVKGAGYRAWRSRVEAVAGCAKPVRLSGSAAWLEAGTGAVVRELDGSILAACNNRRERVCPSCAARYAGDTFHLVQAGLTGGKSVPESVTGHARVFATLTAPSFGPVHTRPTTATGRLRPCSCGERHHEHDTRLGSPIDPTTYDYVGAVLWQAHAPELWRRFTITTARHLAHALGVAPSRLKDHARVSYVKVAEYQRRGLVHFHAVIRVDGPDGPGSLPPAAVTPDLLCAVVRSAAAAVTVDSPESAAVGTYQLGWGTQVDAEPIAASDPADPAQLASDRRVAGYVAKYATKGTGTTAGVDSPIRHEGHIADLDVSEHARVMIATAWRLGGLPEFAGLLLRKWAHMLGFRGHFLTKSRHYSTTFGALRTARGDHHRIRELADLGITDTTDIVVVNDWHMTGIGYRTDAERDIAAAIAEQAVQRRNRCSAEDAGGEANG